MNDTEGARVAQLRGEILKYLGTHPCAADTVEGIANWWLPRQRYDEDIQKVQRALDELVEHGLVAKAALADGTILYGHPERESDAVQ